MWKYSIITASDRIFPGLAYYDRKKEFYDIGNRINTNLTLQITLYLNVSYFPVWLFVILYYLDAKYSRLSEVYKFVLAAIFFTIVSLEWVRLYLGYLGNLSEKIPELTCFWFISTLLQFPLEIFLVFDRYSAHHLNERIFNVIILAFLLIEIITSTIALKQSADHHAKRFYMAQMYGIKSIRK